MFHCEITINNKFSLHGVGSSPKKSLACAHANLSPVSIEELKKLQILIYRHENSECVIVWCGTIGEFWNVFYNG